MIKIVFFQSEGFDYLTSHITEGLSLLARDDLIQLKIIHENPRTYASINDHGLVTEEEALDSIDWADFILFSSGGNMMCFSDAVQRVFADPAHTKKRVFLDGHDSNALLCDPSTTLLYFKREMRYPELNYYQWFNIRSLSFGIYKYLTDQMGFNQDYEAEWERRDIDISLMAFGGSNITRGQVAEHLRRMSTMSGDLKVEVHVANDCQPIPESQYHEILYRSKIGVSPIGAGYDTLRFWETPAHGAVLCSADISDKMFMRNGFEGLRNCIFFNNLNVMEELCRRVVFDKGLWCSMRRSSDKCVANHTTRQRATDMVDMILEVV